MKLKKGFYALAAVLFFLVNAVSQAIIVKAEVDTTPPEFMSVSVNKTAATVGDTVEVTVNAVDNGTGIADIVGYRKVAYVVYSTPFNREARHYLNLIDGQLKASIPIGQYSEPGPWKIKYITLSDNVGNTINVGSTNITASFINVYKNLSGGDFNVSGTTPDNTPPTFNSVTVDKPNPTAGDTVIITVDASDDFSGVVDRLESSGATYLNYKTPSGVTKLISLALVDGKLKGSLSVGQYTEAGVWQISQISIYDKAGNSTIVGNTKLLNSFGSVRSDLSSGNIDITGTTTDILSPTLNGVYLDKTNATAGESVNITLDAVDDVSGFIEGIQNGYPAFVEYTTPSGKKETVSLYLNEGELNGSISIGQYDETGIWKINYISIKDRAGNITGIGNSQVPNSMGSIKMNLSSGDFNVTGTTPDITAPTLTAVTLDKTEATVGERIYITVEACDNVSGLSTDIFPGKGHTSIDYITPSGNRKSFGLNLVDGKLKGSILIGQYSEGGTWKIDRVTLIDNAGNLVNIGNSMITNGSTSNVKRDLSMGDFTVSGTTPDIEAPTLKEITINKKMVAAGDIVNVNISAEDNLSGLCTLEDMEAFTKIVYLTPSGKQRRIFIYEKGSEIKGRINIGPYTEAGLWRILSIAIIDKAGNASMVTNSNIDALSTGIPVSGIRKNLSAGDFVVTGTDSDSKPPTFQSIAVDKNYIVKEESTTITLDAFDDKSGLLSNKSENVSTYIGYENSTGKFIWVHFSLVDGKYIGNFETDALTETGFWKATSLTIVDNAQNEVSINDLSIGGLYKEDLSAADITVGKYYDYNGDNYITTSDLTALTDSYNKEQGETSYEAKYDVTKDGIVDIFDIAAVSVEMD
jgi:hypothetical protein